MNKIPKILVVDDEKVTRILINGILSKKDYEVIEVDSGEDALVIIEEDDIDLLLLDIMMPGLNGFEVLEILKENPKTENLKVIMLTAMDQVDDRVRAYYSGASDYVVKPFKREELLARIETQLKLSLTEENLRRSKEQYEELFEGANEMIFTTDVKGILNAVNRHTEEVTGFKKEELIGKNAAFLAYIEDRDKFFWFWWQILKGEKPTQDLKLRKRNDDYIYVQATGRTVKQDERVALIQVNIQNITERKQAEEALWESEARWRSLIESIPGFVFVIDPEGKILSLNCSFPGFTSEEIVGSSIYEYLFPEDCDLVINEIQQVLGTKETVTFKNRGLGKEGNYEWFETVIGPVINEGQVECFIFLSREIDKRKKSKMGLSGNKNIYSTLVEMSKDSILLEQGEKIIFANSSFYNLFNLSESEILGNNLFKLISKNLPGIMGVMSKEEQRTLIKNTFAKMDGSKRPRLYQVPFKKKNDEIIWVEINVNHIEYEGMPANILIIRDITDQKQIENEIKQKNEELLIKNVELHDAREQLFNLIENLEENVKEKTSDIEKLIGSNDGFLRHLGQDIKTPLSSLNSILSETEENEADQNSKGLLEMSIQNAGYIKNLVINTLQLARLNSKDLVFEVKEISLFEAVNSVILENQAIIEKNNVEIKNNISENITVEGDLLRLKEVFINLVKVNHMGGSGKLTIDAIENEDGFATVSVKCEGLKLDDEIMTNFSKGFNKSDRSRHKLDSSFIGLAICKRIVENNGGSIWVKDTVEEGTVFYFTIPAKRKIANINTFVG